MTCSAPGSSRPHSAFIRSRSASGSSRPATTSRRSRPTSCDSSTVRPGASPSQNGIVGGAPRGASTRTWPGPPRLLPPGGAAGEEAAPGHAFPGEVLIGGPDKRVVRLGDDAVVGRLRDGAAVEDGAHAGAAPAPQHAVDAVSMQQGRRPAGALADAPAPPLAHALDG